MAHTPQARTAIRAARTQHVQIAERIVAYKRLGVDLFLLGFLHYLEEVEYFGKRVLPLVRELETARPAPV
jgi:dimethylsulfone monooxygenase